MSIIIHMKNKYGTHEKSHSSLLTLNPLFSDGARRLI